VAYYNGTMTLIYCDDCAESEIPLPPAPASDGTFADDLRFGARHHGTGFKWAPWAIGGAGCSKCGAGADQ